MFIFCGIPIKDEGQELQHLGQRVIAHVRAGEKKFRDLAEALADKSIPLDLPVRVPLKSLGFFSNQFVCGGDETATAYSADLTDRISALFKEGVGEVAELEKGRDLADGLKAFGNPSRHPPENTSQLGKIPAGFRTYYNDCFGGRFKDRNGTPLEFNLNKLKTLASEIGDTLSGKSESGFSSTSLETTSQLIAVLVEFLGDATFQVPFFSSELAVAPKAKIDASKQKADLETEMCAALNDLGDTVDTSSLDFLRDSTKRQALRRLTACDDALLKVNDRLLIFEKLTAPGNTPEKVKIFETFTCYSAKLIDKPIPGICLNNQPDTKDYAPLVGAVVATLATGSAAKIRSLVGSAIRGGAIASLQNESVAEIAAATAACVAKKIEEAVTFELLRHFIENQAYDISFTLPWDGKTVGRAELLNIVGKSFAKDV